MDGETRSELARKALAGYVNGPEAPAEATRLALAKTDRAHAIVIVEGISDQIAIETLAARRGRDLNDEGTVVLPVGGAQAAVRYLKEFGPHGEQLHIAGLCDADAADTICSALAAAGIGEPQTIDDMASLGFHVCIKDLEDELIRAVGPSEVEALIESQGELGALRTFQKQPEWRGRPLGDQLHRFFGSKARRSLRYARLLIDVVGLDRVPRPLDGVLASS